jgi:dCMP deaminase
MDLEVSTRAARPSWDEYFMGLTQEVAKRATCDRGRSGCIVVKDKRIVATGYVGSPPGLAHCDDVGHLLKKVVDEDGTIRQHCVRTTHAEQNAICQAARYGIPLDGTTLYCKMEPCRVCAMLIISVGITRVVAQKRYHAAQDTRDMFRDAGVQLDVLEEAVEEYRDQ